MGVLSEDIPKLSLGISPFAISSCSFLVEVLSVGPVEAAGPGVEPRLGLVHRPLLDHALAGPPPLRLHRQQVLRLSW